PGDVNFRRGPIRREEGRMQLSSLDPIVFTLEIDVACGSPKGVAYGKKLLGAGISVVVGEKVPIAALLGPRTAPNHVQTHPALEHRGNSVDLLNECRRQGQPGAKGGDELQLLRGAAERATNKERIRLVPAE